MRYEKNRNLFFYIMLGGLGILAIYIWNSAYENTVFDSEPCYELNTGWTYIDASGHEQSVVLPVRLEENAAGYVELFYDLPGPPKNIIVLCIRTSHQGIEVFSGDTLIYSYSAGNAGHSLGRTGGSVWNIIRLPETRGRICLRLSSPYPGRAGAVSNVYGGTKASILFYLMKQYGGGLLMAGFILILGFVLLGLYAVFRKLIDHDMSFLYLGGFAVFTAVWLFGESKMTEFFTGNQIFILYMTYESLMLVSVPIQQYVTGIPDFHYKKQAEVFLWLFYANTVVLTLLQLFHIADFYQTVFVTHLLILCSSVSVLLMLTLDVFRYGNKKAGLAAFAFIVLFLSGVAEMTYFYLIGRAYVGHFVSWGILIFIVVLLSDGMKRVKAAATTDFMTLCGNKTAYLRCIEHIKAAGTTSVVLADINDLKKINDIFGHQAGDEAIVNSGRYLRKIFSKNAACYRTGGDEFVCILHDWRKEDVEKGIQTLM